ncbi:low-density lipoprotein receptor-related protein 2-like isoform X2 [Daktulosphaira vitifoliae]|uniref:low-density lipoprotein receptor-related protein 2-like isoform X2 n=1 Tax=Daktulosphaira vitifoliae TaxID=58002 RepID=UPI0021AA4066|nr:low-density lipoprotein receptor-related protein 2-like isoform X2 [Daktulosphaira vitifoliae]
MKMQNTQTISKLFATSAYKQKSTASAYGPCDGWIWVCDYNNDHFYSTDDVNYVNFIRLRKYGNLSIFECNNGKRIEMIQRCDNTNDCGDNSDEYDCEFLFRNKYQLPNKIPGVYFFHTEKECSSDIKNRFNTKSETDVSGRLNIGCSNNIRVCRRLIQFDSEVGVSNIIILKQKNIDCSPRKHHCSGDFIKKSCLCEELTDCFDGKCEKNCTDNSDFNQIYCFSQEATRFPPTGKKLYEKWEAAPLLSTYNINHCSGSLGACGSSCDSISTEYEINYLKTKSSSPYCHKYSTLNDNTKLFICGTRHQLNEDNTMSIICDSQKNKPFSPMCNMDKSLLCCHRESKSFEQIKCRESIIELVENIVESKQ